MFEKVKKINKQKILSFLNYNLTPLDMFNGNGPSQVYCISNQKKEFISIQRVIVVSKIDENRCKQTLASLH